MYLYTIHCCYLLHLQVKHGVVRIRDSKILTGSEYLQNSHNVGCTSGKLVRLELSGDTLKIQEVDGSEKGSENHTYDDVAAPKVYSSHF